MYPDNYAAETGGQAGYVPPQLQQGSNIVTVVQEHNQATKNPIRAYLQPLL